MQEPIRIDVPHFNGHGHHRGSSLSSLDPPSAGFTAVNGFRPRSIGFRPDDTATSPYAASEKESLHRPSSGIAQYPAHGWRPAESNSPQASHELPERDSPITGKRKRNDVETFNHVPIESLNGDRNDPMKRSSTTLDSAVDLTSPENPSEPLPVEATDSDSSEQAGTYERQTTPTERWNQGDPPPKPRPETAAVLAASLHQFQQQNPEYPATHQVQARSLTPYTHDTSPPNESDHMGEPHGYSDDQYHVDGSDPKRRKRNFSNRTKTGCHTCRKRKKKCDEGKPTCQNCERSGHPCEGYGPKPPGDGKPPGQNRVMPLQSKTPMASYNGRNSEPSGRAEEGRSYSHWGRVPPPPPPPEPEPRPFLPVAQVPPADLRRPNTADNWQKSAYHPQEPPPGYHHERLPPPSNFSHQPPHQIVYGPPPQQHPTPQQFTAQPQYQAPPPQHPPSHVHQPPQQPPPPQPQPRQTGPLPPPHIPLEPWGHQPGPPPYPVANGVSPPSMVSSRESVHSGSQRSGTFGMEYAGHRLIEKDKMLRGQPFLHYLDRVLIEDREACRAAVERYNKAAEMNSGVSAAERGRLFTNVLKPARRPNPKARDTQHNVPVGHIGDHTVVETPFKCEYGYNIHIGKECIIESGAYLQDAADIGIGNRVTIGPNVKLYCITANIDPSARKGSHSTVVAGAIAIQDESFIGADSIVMPFVTVGRGAVVGAGSVVTKDVEPLTVVAGNPAKLIRRIEGSNVGRHHSQQIQRQQENMQQWMKEYANSGFSTYTSKSRRPFMGCTSSPVLIPVEGPRIG